MFELFTLTSFLLLLSGIGVGILGVVIGGSMFFSIPIVQLFFPTVPFGAIVGNIKIGSLFRGIGSTISTLSSINIKENILLSIPLLCGTIAGASFVAQLDQRWIFPAIVFAVILAELAPYMASKITNTHFIFFSLIVGIYTGFLGAGVGILILALLRTKFSKDSDIAHAKIQTRFIELLLAVVAVVTHIFHGNIFSQIWIPLALGGIIGGYLGGVILNRIGTLSGKIQKIILRVAFVFAIFVAGWEFF